MRDVAREFYVSIQASTDSIAARYEKALRGGDLLLFAPQQQEQIRSLTASGLSAEQLKAVCGLLTAAAHTSVGSVLAEIDQRSAMGDDPEETVRLVDVEGARLSNDLHSEFADFRLQVERSPR